VSLKAFDILALHKLDDDNDDDDDDHDHSFIHLFLLKKPLTDRSGKNNRYA